MIRFLLGFVIGGVLGAAVVVFTAPRSGPAARQNINDTVQGALDAARQASTSREQQMWSEFRERLAQK